MADDWSQFPAVNNAATDEWDAFPRANVTDDVIRSAGGGLFKGAMNTAGAVGDIRNAFTDLTGWAARKLGASDKTVDTVRSVVDAGYKLNPITMLAPTSKQVREAVTPFTGEPYKPQTTAGEFASSAAEFVPGSLLMPGGMARNVALGVTAGLGSEAGGQLAKDTPSEPMMRIVGALAGGAGPVAAAPLANALGRNTMGWVGASVNPQGFANRQMARAVAESGMTPQQIAHEVAAGRAAGQPLTVADAMGNAGQRMLSNVARAPGVGRTMAVDFLEGRQGDQGRRMAQILAEGFDAPRTAAQTRKAMETARRTAGNANYGAARAQAGAVDISPAIAHADNFLRPGATRLMNPAANIADDSVEAAVRRARAYLTDGRSQITDFNGALRAKMELDAMIEGARPTVQRQLIPIRDAVDEALAATSKPYAAAKNQYRQHSRAIEAIDTGRAAAQRGRTEDTTRAFGALSPQEQAGFRVGYADNLIEGVQGGAMGQNKARPFTSQAMQTELPIFAAPGRAQPMMQQIGRENRMFETRAHALGGSKTADNLADMQAAGVDPISIITNALSGNFTTAARNLVGRSSGALSGYTPRVRELLAMALIEGNGTNLPVLTQGLSPRDRLLIEALRIRPALPVNQ